MQFILYDATCLSRLALLGPAGDRRDVLLVVGDKASGRCDPAELRARQQALPSGWCWMACGFGPAEQRIAEAAARLGGHVRVGFENNRQLADGRPADDNAALVRQAVAAAEAAGRPVAGAQAARRLFGLEAEGA